MFGNARNHGIEERRAAHAARGRLLAFCAASVFLVLGLLPGTALAQAVPPGCSAQLGTADLIDHNFSVSFCELCSRGTVRIEVENPFDDTDDLDFSDFTIAEDLRSSGLTYVPASATFSGANISVPAAFEPSLSGPNNSVVTWDFAPTQLEMAGRPGGPGNRASFAIQFEVERAAGFTEEGLLAANRNIEASVELEPSCALPAATYQTSTGVELLPLREPEPTVTKEGRNLDAGQGSYTDPVYGHEGDDVLWRIQIANSGAADLQDFVFDDSMTPGNFEIDYLCDSEGDAISAGSGGPTGNCDLIGPTTSIANVDVAARFGGGATPYVVAPAGGIGAYYFVGRITDSCSNQTNTVSGVEWGCQSESPIGGLSATSGGATAGDDALLSTASVAGNVDIDVALTGLDTSQPMGATGRVTVTITNNSGGTITGEAAGLRIRNLLPAEYVVDATAPVTIDPDPAYGASYLGMIDTVAWTNPAAPGSPLDNTELQLLLTSSTTQTNSGLPDQRHMIRHGDEITVSFRTVLIDPTYYDYVADLDVRIEAPASTPPGTDPTETFPIANQTEVWWEEFCTATLHNRVINESDTANPEDLDVDISGAELIFILTNTGDPLPLTVELRNRGGHDAANYTAYVTFGEAMTVQTVPTDCTPFAGPFPRPVWQDPVGLPATASVYACDRGTLNPGETESLDFEVVKNTAASFDDDLTFRADVIGEITLSDGTPLDFPAPTPRADGEANTVNDYSVDTVWARVIGYNLFKEQLGLCTENNVPPNSPDVEIQIGEECSFRVESGGWFGFETPGFTYIAVQNIQVVDELPDGQAYISSTDPLLTSTASIQGVSLNPPPDPLDEGDFDWTFNTVVPAERITEKDHWFRADVSTRLLNDPVDSSAPPNEHDAQTSNVMTSTFDAVFFNQSTSAEEVYNLGPNTLGFPREVHRRVDLTVTEPRLTVTKEVCNETLHGIGSACDTWVDLANDGDAFDTYVYRIRVENEQRTGSVDHAPAYDVTVTSVTDPTDQLGVLPLTTDTADNDGDGNIDGADGDGEGTITDNVTENGNPAQVIASYTHSAALRRIDPGQSVELFYRVDPDDDVAPLQALVSSVTATYDSLEGASGSQTVDPRPNGEIGGARQYTTAPDTATIQIIPVEVSPKRVLRVSNSGLSVPANPQSVSIGEEVEFQIEALIPVAQLRDFVIRDELPTGLRCIDAPVVNLNAGPYAAAGFVPGGSFTPTCTGNLVEWDFGNQTVTMSDRMDRRFEFEVQFIARVENVATSRDGDSIVNGGAATVTEVRYTNESSTRVVLEVGEATLLVQEPELEITTVFSVPSVDAADVPRITVTATNNGNATAYNPRFLTDLTGVELTYQGDIQGTNPPTDDIVTIGPDAPIFSWPPGLAVAPTESISFSFAVQVDDTVEPERVLEAIAQADWTSLPSATTALNPGGSIGTNGAVDGMRIGALPNAADPLNDYEAEGEGEVPVRPVTITKTDLAPTQDPEIGSHRSFQIEVGLPEGITQGVIVRDALDSGAVSYVLAHNATYDITYEFIGLDSINGETPAEAEFLAIPADQTTGTATWDIGTVTTLSEDDLVASAITPMIRIRYSARIPNDLATNTGSTFQNTATAYSTSGETGLEVSVSDTTAIVTAIESAVTATKVLSNVTTGKAAGDPPAFRDTLQYTVTLVNGGNATAYDINIVDTLPPELELIGTFTPTAAIDTVPVAGFTPVPAGAPDGPLVWGRQNGDNSLDLPQGSALVLTYQVEVSSPPADGAVLTNTIYTDWTSLDVDPGALYERTGAGCPTITAPNDYCFGPAVSNGTVDPAPPASPLIKANTQATASVGEIFRYRITVPQTPYAFPIYDVRVYDDLSASAADLRFLSTTKVSGSGPWVPENTGTPTDLVLEDASGGIDIPAGEQAVFEIAVVLEDTPTNVTGLTFTNTANYIYNWLDGNASTQRTGAAGTSANMTLVGPDTAVMDKRGPATLTLGAPGTYTLNVQNTGTGPAWNLTLVDTLPNLPAAGTCDTPPTDFTAQVFEADGVTAVSAPLALGTDFTAVTRGDPDCDVTLQMLTPAAAVGATERLIATYSVVLDDDSQNGETITNIAGATAWFSAEGGIPETASDRRSFSRTLTDGTPATADHEDAFTSSVALPIYTFEKTVQNITTGENPATVASPGDVLRYRVRLENLRAAPLEAIVITDELDRLNAPVAFEPGSLTIISAPVGADTSNTNAAGGAGGTGLLDVRGLELLNLGDALEIEFEATLGPILSNGRAVLNQAQATTSGVAFADSDDPVLNGAADPFVAGDEDPTAVTIQSAPDFTVEKTSSYETGDPALLLAGETLRYTLTVKNVGNDHATDARLRDSIPVGTAYVPGSATLNGIALTDAPGGVSPLVSGIPINAPEDGTPGAMRADPSATPLNIATLTFDVVVDPNAIDGTIVSNQAFVSAIAGGVSDQPSDDPDTAIPDDPTQDVVGNAPLLFSAKSAALQIDGGTAGVVDPGDTLRYTITTYNNGAAPATETTLTDAVPANTTYVVNSLTLNTLPVGQPDGGTSPLIAGIPISDSTLTPPVPSAGSGQIMPGENAVVTFDLLVDAGVPGGTIISNQAVVASAELPNLLTDGDGNPATGPEPTLVVVGAGQTLSITKEVSVVGGGPALAGSELEYLVRVTNIGTAPATSVVITDNLDLPDPGQLTFIPASATLNGSPAGITIVGPLLTADYGATYGDLPPSGTALLRFRARLDGGLSNGTTVTNIGSVQWNAPPQTADASVSVSIGGTPGVGAVGGTLWYDANFDGVQDPAEVVLTGWTVELQRGLVPIQTTTTDSNGEYTLTGIAPNTTNGDIYTLEFRAPDAGTNTARLGVSQSPYTNGLQSITNIPVAPGSNLLGLNLPIDPSGIVYDALDRLPVSGAAITMVRLESGTQSAVAATCFDDPNQQGQITGASGYYKFDMNFSDASCPVGEEYLLIVTEAGGDFTEGISQTIPPQSDASTPAFNVPACPGNAAFDAVTATALRCEAAPTSQPAAAGGDPRGPATNYYLHLLLDGTQVPGSSQLFNNHLPVDPVPGGAVAITKTTPAINVSRGDLVPYEITFNNLLGADIDDLGLRDRFPAGFRYVEGSARVDGVPMEPIANGRVLEWRDLEAPAGSSRTVVLLLTVGAGVTEGEFVNQAEAFSGLTGIALSGVASATVRVVPDPTFDCTDVLGKVFDDRNRNGVQDEGELGLPRVRVVTVRGLSVQTDPHGRFHITCPIVPNETRGSNFVLKLDDRTLPSGYRMSTRITQTKRATRGKALRFQFGASIHRVIGLDVADAAFEPESTSLRAQWTPRLVTLLDELEKGPSVLRLSYVADVEGRGLVKRRVKALEKTLREAWQARGGDELEIETEIFWRRGEKARPAFKNGDPPRTSALYNELPPVGAGPPGLFPASGQSGERHLPVDETSTRWSLDPEVLETTLSDRLEEKEVVEEKIETIKLKGVVPPIRFESGAAEIPESSVERIRTVLREMQHLDNVRLHLLGHTDDQALSPALSSVFGDNQGLSRERAGEVAEFLQAALKLPPESISFAWVGDADPVASNTTPEGRARNRRVEVEVWYDEPREHLAVKEVVVPEDIKRYKVCRTETVCKLRYREGHERRARIKNLIAPLTYEDEIGVIPRDFIEQIREAFGNLRNKDNVTVKLIAHTDDAPLSGRAERIYGTHLSLSKARGHRVALAVKDALGLPTAAIASDGRGSSQPVAANATARGRALNRRIEVEFWHDDPLLELSDDFQVCPDPADAERIDRVYDPPGGGWDVLEVKDGEVQIPAGFAAKLESAMQSLSDKDGVRLRFVGYTRNERLTRRMADVYGDDIGLSASRARRAMERIQTELVLRDEQVEHEGRGFVHSSDVVNGGFLQGATSHVVAQVVYDELAVMDDYEGIEVTPITRELKPKDPLALNLMRITVDGEPLDDPGRSSADIQRCTDVALDRTAITFQFDGLTDARRLSASAAAISTEAGPAIRFRADNNYPHFIARSEIRILNALDSVRATPVAVVPIDVHGFGTWSPGQAFTALQNNQLKYVLRVYQAGTPDDETGVFDETAPQNLRLTPLGGNAEGEADARAEAELVADYGGSEAMIQNIPLGSAGSVVISGREIPEDHSVWLAGTQLPVDSKGDVIGEVILPAGLHTVEVAVLDDEGNGELFFRDLEMERDDWFFVGLADLTLAQDLSGGPSEELAGDNATDLDAFANGRLAFFTNGKFGTDWELTASADTREGPVEELFTNFLDKAPDSLFRRLDPDYHYPTFGDDSTVEELAPTLGKFFVKLDKGDDHLLWGNFLVRYQNNELALVERGLYGANARYQSDSTTAFGERRFGLDGFAADPGTVPSREEFRGTGGSVYFLKRQDLLIGSERLRIEVRDKDSGLVREVISLQPELDYDIDYFQGRVLLSEPLSAIADDRLLVRNDGLAGHEAVLVVQYEFTPGFDEVDTLNVGGQGHAWVTDFLKLGVTASRNDDSGNDSSLYAADLTLRKSAGSWIKVQASRSEGLVSTSLQSGDGGFSFGAPVASVPENTDAYGYRADISVALSDWFKGFQGQFSLYGQRLEAGYSAPGLNTQTDTDQYGGVLRMPIANRVDLVAKGDRVVQERGLVSTTAEVNVETAITENWRIALGARHDAREDKATQVAVTQEEGDRTDAVAEIGFDPKGRWKSYAFVQATVASTENREENHRGGLGGAFQVTDQIVLDGEVSHGNTGPAAQLGSSYQHNERTKLYVNYALDNDRGYDGLYERRGSLTAGTRSRLSDSASVYMESQYQHAAVTGLTRSIGLDYTPTERWTIGVNWEDGTTRERRTPSRNRAPRGRADGRLPVRRSQSHERFRVRLQRYGTDERKQLGSDDLATAKQSPIPDERRWPAAREVQPRDQRELGRGCLRWRLYRGDPRLRLSAHRPRPLQRAR